MTQEEYLGPGSISNLPKIILKNNANRILLVTGNKSYSESGIKDAISPYLSNIDIFYFNDFDINPTLEDACRGIKLIKDLKPDLIIAIGGGSVIDMAKSINILSYQASNNYIQVISTNSIVNNGVPLLAIPTTTGTGSEATHFSVIYIDKVKFSLAHKYILPDYVIVDPELIYNLPKYILACSGLDALSQAIESYWAVGATSISKRYASQAIKIMLPSIIQAVCEKDRMAINSMAIGANLAGKAINISKTTAAHALSYPITTYYNIPHGHAVALTLGRLFIVNSIKENMDIEDPRGLEYINKTMINLYTLMGCDSAKECCEKWYILIKTIGLESKLTQIGLRSNRDKKKIINNINPERLNNNPIRLKQDLLFYLIED